MGQEIERKFLTCSEAWRSLAEGILYRQGYVDSRLGHQVTVKTIAAPGRTSGFIQVTSPQLAQPFEFLIPVGEAINLLEELCVEQQTTTHQGLTERSGQLSTVEGHTIRFRIAGSQGILTLKTKTIGISRSEFEFEIPMESALQLLNQVCEKPQIEKYRRKIPHRGFIWEVDEFLGENEGLVIAEIELDSETQEFEKPDWIGSEVSGDRRYYNSYLVKMPFSKWQ